MASAAGVRAGRAFVEVTLLDRLDAGFRRAEQRMQRFAATMRAMSAKLFRAASLGAIPLGLSLKIGANFEDQMAEVLSVTHATRTEFERLVDQAKLLGRTTSFTAVEVGSAQAEFGRAGFNPDEIQNITPGTLDLSRGTKTELAATAGIQAATLRQFGLAATEATHVADLLTVASNKSFNTLSTLGEALTYVGTTASDAGMSLEDTLAVLGSLGNVGIQGSNAGTALRRLITLGAAEADKLKKIFGVSFVDAAGNARPLVDALEEVNEATKNLGSADRAAKFNEAFGLLGITAASSLGKAAGSTRELRAALEQADGAAAATAATMDDTLGGTFRRILSATEGVAIAVSEALSPAVRTIGEQVAVLLGDLTDWISRNQELIVLLGTATVGAGALSAGLLALSAGLSLASRAMLPLRLLSRLLVSPLRLITLVTSGVGGLYRTVLPLSRLLAGFGRTLASLSLGAGARAISGTFRGLMAVVAPFGRGIVTAVSVGAVSLLRLGSIAVSVGGMLVASLGRVAAAAVIRLSGLLLNLGIVGGGALLTLGMRAQTTALSLARISFTGLKNGLQAVTASVIAGTRSLMAFSVAAAKATVMNSLRLAASGLSSAFSLLISPMGLTVVAIGAIGYALYHLLGGFDGIRTGVAAIWNTVSQVLGDVRASSRRAWGELYSIGAMTWGKLVGRIASGDLAGAFRLGLLSVKAMWASVVASFVPQWVPIVSTVKALWQSLIAFLRGSLSALGTLFEPLLTPLREAWDRLMKRIGGNGLSGVFMSWTDAVSKLQKVLINLEFAFKSMAAVATLASKAELAAIEKQRQARLAQANTAARKRQTEVNAAQTDADAAAAKAKQDLQTEITLGDIATETSKIDRLKERIDEINTEPLTIETVIELDAAEAALKQAERRLAALRDSLPDGADGSQTAAEEQVAKNQEAINKRNRLAEDIAADRVESKNVGKAIARIAQRSSATGESVTDETKDPTTGFTFGYLKKHRLKLAQKIERNEALVADFDERQAAKRRENSPRLAKAADTIRTRRESAFELREVQRSSAGTLAKGAAAQGVVESVQTRMVDQLAEQTAKLAAIAASSETTAAGVARLAEAD
jgi:TP901 family phage tail tape measure protein